MPTNNERREVAAMLRKYTYYAKKHDANNPLEKKVENGNSMFRNIAQAVGGGCSNMTDTYEETLLKLIDLIEPEPERTCRVTKKGPEFVLAGWWECSECGPVYPPCSDEIAIWALQKCPRCGAKVVME